MAYYGVFLDLAGRSCFVAGGGEVAERKIDGLLRAGARVTVVAPSAGAGIVALAASGEIRHVVRTYRPGDLEGVFLAIAATDDEACHREIAAEAAQRGVLLNVVDAPELCGFIAPALLERGELLIAVSTSGAAPALAGRVRDQIASVIGPEYAPALRVLRRVRERLHDGVTPAAERQRLLRDLAASDLPEQVRRGDRREIERLLTSLLGSEVTLQDLGVALD